MPLYDVGVTDAHESDDARRPMSQVVMRNVFLWGLLLAFIGVAVLLQSWSRGRALAGLADEPTRAGELSVRMPVDWTVRTEGRFPIISALKITEGQTVFEGDTLVVRVLESSDSSGSQSLPQVMRNEQFGELGLFNVAVWAAPRTMRAGGETWTMANYVLQPPGEPGLIAGVRSVAARRLPGNRVVMVTLQNFDQTLSGDALVRAVASTVQVR
ncbi:MAG: hypothetical protein AAGK78_01805 [Planctomycetota bacterium]